MNCIILHGCPPDEESLMNFEEMDYYEHWIPWTKKELENKGIKVSIPMMPEPWNAVYGSWKNEFEKLKVNEETILIGHSCGCAFLVRYLGDTKKKVKKLILVAPWKIPGENNEREKNFYNYHVNDSVKSQVGETIIFTSNDEEEEGKESAKIFQKALNGKLIELKNHGHYFQFHTETQEFPELLEAILE